MPMTVEANQDIPLEDVITAEFVTTPCEHLRAYTIAELDAEIGPWRPRGANESIPVYAKRLARRMHAVMERWRRVPLAFRIACVERSLKGRKNKAEPTNGRKLKESKWKG